MPNAAPKASEGVRLHGISQAAFDLIVEFEVSSEATYNKLYRRPTKPGGSSGITIGIGYDCGYSTAAQIRVDWGGLLPADMIVALMTVAGVTGARAALALPAVRDKVDVPWVAALAVFSNTSIPKYLAKASQLPNWDMLSPDCKGALLSLVYNRGPSFDNAGSRYQEMRNIKSHMASGRFSAIPTELRSMKRIWRDDPDMRGLLARRDKEADLFEQGLKVQKPAPAAPAPKPEPPSPIPAQPAPRPSFWAAFFMAIAAIFKRK
jgi:hypothetical protein